MTIMRTILLLLLPVVAQAHGLPHAGGHEPGDAHACLVQLEQEGVQFWGNTCDFWLSVRWQVLGVGRGVGCHPGTQNPFPCVAAVPAKSKVPVPLPKPGQQGVLRWIACESHVPHHLFPIPTQLTREGPVPYACYHMGFGNQHGVVTDEWLMAAHRETGAALTAARSEAGPLWGATALAYGNDEAIGLSANFRSEAEAREAAMRQCRQARGSESRACHLQATFSTSAPDSYDADTGVRHWSTRCAAGIVNADVQGFNYRNAPDVAIREMEAHFQGCDREYSCDFKVVCNDY